MKTDKKNKLAKSSLFVIDNMYLDKIEISCIGDIGGDLSNDKDNKLELDGIKVDIIAQNTNLPSMYYMEITVDILTIEKAKLILGHGALLKFIVLVKVDESANDNQVLNILNKKVPNELFESIESVISNTMKALVGYSVKISRKRFMDSVQEIEMQEAEDYDYSDLDADSRNGTNNEEYEIIDYHQILKEMSELAPAREFLGTYQSYIGPNVIDNYETLPAYKYYYRFFLPIEYNHPDIKGCDESVWPMLFQLLWGNMEASCGIVDRGKECPEIEVFYNDYRGLVSELSKKDLKNLLDNLVTDMLTKDGVELISYKLINKYYGETINTSRRIFKHEFFYLYGYSDENDILENEKEFLYSRYSKIKKCDLKTQIYRLKRKN